MRSPASQARRCVATYPVGLLWGSVGLFALMAGASLFLAGPQIEVDEGSYLLTAATLAGKIGANSVNGYYSGYSLLLVPAFLTGTDPVRIYHAALLINALLVASVPFALFRLTRTLFPAIDPRWHAASAAAATSYASLLLVSQHAMSESALVPLYAWFLATAAETAIARRISSAALCGVAAGLLFLVHPRGGLMAGAVLVVLAGFSLRQANLRGAMAVTWICALGIAALHGSLEHLAGKPEALGSAYSVEHVWRQLLQPSNWKWIALNGFGALSEAIAASLGIAAIGLLALASELRSIRTGGLRAVTARVAIMLCLLLGFAVALLMSAVFFIPPSRADHIAYGRYALPATIPIVAVGLLRFSRARAGRRRDGILALAAGIASILTMAMAFARLPPMTTTTWNYVNAPTLFIAQYETHIFEQSHNGWWEIGLCFVVVAGALHLIAAASRRGGITTYIAINVLIAALAWQTIPWPNARTYAVDANVVAAANAFEAVTGSPLCVDLSPELGLDVWFDIDMRWRMLNALPDTVRHDRRACSTALVAALNGTVQDPDGARLIAVERQRPLMKRYIGLFVEPGAALNTWKAKMPPVPREILAPLPEGEHRAHVDVLAVSAVPHLEVGDVLGLDVRVVNNGARSTWPATDVGPYPILLGARSYLGDKAQAVGEYRARLGRALAPGDSTTAHIDVGPFTRAGTYRVSVGIVQEFVAWFADTTDVLVEVRDR